MKNWCSTQSAFNCAQLLPSTIYGPMVTSSRSTRHSATSTGAVLYAYKKSQKTDSSPLAIEMTQFLNEARRPATACAPYGAPTRGWVYCGACEHVEEAETWDVGLIQRLTLQLGHLSRGVVRPIN